MAKAKEAAGNKGWRNRIVGQGERPASGFVFNALNWRLHPKTQRDALNEIFSKIGWVTGVIVNKRTGNLIDGHARIEEALKQGESSPVPYIEVDLTADEEKQILLLLDPIGGMAVTDSERFRELAEIVDVDTSGLLEVIADLSRLSKIETAELPKADTGVGELLTYFSFGKTRVPLSEEELDELNRRFEKYVEENQVVYGFVSELLGL